MCIAKTIACNFAMTTINTHVAHPEFVWLPKSGYWWNATSWDAHTTWPPPGTATVRCCVRKPHASSSFYLEPQTCRRPAEGCRKPCFRRTCDRAPSHMGQRQSIVVPSPVVEQILASPSPKKGLRISHKHKYVGISPSFLHLTIQLAAGQGHRPLYYAGLAPSRNTSEERCKATESPMSPPAAGVFLVASPPEQ